MSEYATQSKIAGHQSRIYPLALKKKIFEKRPEKKPKKIIRKFSVDTVPEFITELLDEKPQPRTPVHSKINFCHRSAYSSLAKNRIKDSPSPDIPVNSEIPKIFLNDFKKKPTSQKPERYFIENTFYISPRSKFTLYARAYINPTRTVKFTPIITKKFQKRGGKKSAKTINAMSSLNTKIAKVFNLVSDPVLSA